MRNRVTGTRRHAAAVEFFYENAGYSYTPGQETAEQGRRRCARALAVAEATAGAIGVTYSWDIDPDVTSADWTDERPAWQTWQCFAECDGLTAALVGIDFGRDGSPHSHDYARVIEAELAEEIIANMTRRDGQ